MKLAIVGSVSLEGNVKAYEIIDEVIAIYAPDEIISGGARGIDSMAAERAWEHNIPMTVFLPKDRSWKHGFKPRNLQIAQACDVLVRIVAKGSKTYGSGWTRDRAKEMGNLLHLAFKNETLLCPLVGKSTTYGAARIVY